MIPLAVDAETALFRPGTMAPELACIQWQSPGIDAEVTHHTEAEPLLRAWLENPEILFTGANIAYDMAVFGSNFPHLLPLIFAAYEADRVADVQIRERLLDIAAGRFQGFLHHGKWQKPRYSLDDLSRKYGFGPLDKGVIYAEDGTRGTNWDADRFGYGALIKVPFCDWPAKAIAYAKRDAEVTLGVHLLQEKHAAEYLPTQFHETRAALALHLASAWGLRTDGAKVEELRAGTQDERDEVQARLVEAGLVRKDGSRDTKAAAAHMVKVCERDALPLRLTDGGNVALDADACNETEDPILLDYARFVTLGAMLNKDVKALLGGTEWPIHTRFGLAASGRVTSSSPNVQNWKR